MVLNYVCVALVASMAAGAAAENARTTAAHASLSEGEEALERAHKAMTRRDYESAYADFRAALDLLDATKTSQRAEAREGVAVSGTRWAQERAEEGENSDAATILRQVLAVKPGYAPARQLLAEQASSDTPLRPERMRGAAENSATAEEPASHPQPGSSASEASVSSPIALVKVFFGTDRAPSGENGPSNYFGSGHYAEGDHLLTGYVNVSIPPTHHAGQVERPWKFFIWQGQEDEKKHVMLKELKRLDENEFYSSLHQELAQRSAGNRSAFVFIYGYNVSFDKAAYRTAELAYDLGFPGVPIMYSWPAQTKLFTYAGDLESAELSAPHLQHFLERIARDSGATRIHVVAHSMGNKVLTGALERIARERHEPFLDNVIMAAPDINLEAFKESWPELRQVAHRFTLYASSDDRALITAMKIRGGAEFKRLGLGGPEIAVLKGLDSIDASGIDTSLLGHGYEAVKPVIDDVALLVEKGLTPVQRKLRDRTKDGLAYWLLPLG